VADVIQNEQPIYFKLTKHTKEYWQFENPNHDFPKKIIYRKMGKERMACTIEGNGKHKNFYFEKTNY